MIFLASSYLPSFLHCFLAEKRFSNSRDLFASSGFDGFFSIFAFVANSGIGGPNTPDENDRFEELIHTNLIGTYYTLRAAQKYLLEGTPTHLVVISSCLARFGVPGYTGYCASKAGLLGMVRAFALEVASRGTQINAICPGWVDTEMATSGLNDMASGLNISFEDAKQQAMGAVPLGYMGKPKDVAGMVAYRCLLMVRTSG